MSHRGLPRRYTRYIMINGERHKLFDLPAEFVEHVKALARVFGRPLSVKELADEYEQYKREKGLVANG